MTKAKATPSGTQELFIKPLKRASITLRIIGTTPMFQNRMANKVKGILLVGSTKKTASQKAAIKHNPMQEFRDSMEIIPDGPTALGVRMTAVKAAMCDAALETDGIKKSSCQRLLFMPGDFAPLYGTPQLRMDVTRSADMNRTPDIRTRAFLPKWGAEVEVQYIVPQFSASSVVSLLANAGILIGIGDYRQQKGKGAFGSFRVITTDEQDDEWDDLVANHGRMKQLVAIEHPDYADRDTIDLMAFYEQEAARRAA